MNNSIKRAQSQARLSFAERENFRPKVRQYKKLMMTLALLLTAVTGAWADELTVHDKTATNNLVPVYGNCTDAYLKCEIVMPATELSAMNGSEISAMTFYAYQTNVSWGNASFQVFLKEVSEPTIGDFSGPGTVVYEGALSIVDGEMTVTFTRPYTYNGGNLLIGVYNTAKGSHSDCAWYGEQVTGASVQGHNYNALASVTPNQNNNAWRNFLPKTTFTYIEPPIEVNPVAEPAEGTKQWTFTQPGSNVVLTPIYAKAAAFATTGSGSEVTTLAPAVAKAIIIAGTDAPLIVEGTVAKAGETEVRQGTVMYAVTPATVTDATELTSSDWKNTVPTAKNIADGGAEVKVWYYIQGADAPDGEAATLDNTFNDSEVSSLTVTVLSNKFDLTLNPANVNTIDATDASKGTVTVDGTDKTTDITEGKLQGVKMGSEVKMTAKPGYKFRKVEVKKAASTPTLKDALADGAVTRIKFNYGGGEYYADFTYSNGSFTRTGGSNGYNFSGSWTMKEENGVLTMTANYNESGSQYIDFVCTFYVDTNEYTAKSTGSWNYSFKGIEVNGKDITDQLTKVK